MVPTATETTSESWQELEALYHAALATRGEAREALLAQVGPGLRAKVEALLANSEPEEGKLDRPAWEWDDGDSDATTAARADMPHGSLMGPYRIEAKVGPYRIEAKVGSGSMGVVYLAIDTRLHRQVALKICQAEFMSRFLGRALEQQKRYVEAIETFKNGLKLDGNVELWSGLGHVYAVSGNTAEAQKVLDHMRDLSTQQYIGPYNFALIYAGMGDKDKAFEWLNHAYDTRSYLLVEYMNTDSRLGNLHDDPRFSVLRSRVGLPAPGANKNQ